jgi:hypothetical protein
MPGVTTPFDDDDTAPDSGGDFEEVKDLLAEHGVVLPEETNRENFVTHLRVALSALHGRLEPVGDATAGAGLTPSPYAGGPGLPTSPPSPLEDLDHD